MKYRPYHILVYLVFAVLLVYVFSPYLWLFSAAFTQGANLAVRLTGPFTLANFASVFSGQTMRWIANSLLISSTATVVSIILTAPGGYALSRGRFRGKGTLMYGIILTRVIPATLIIVPLYSMLSITHLLNTYSGLIIVYIGISIPLNLWIMRGAAEAIPVELEEAASIDGARRWRILLSIVMPLMGPGMGAAGVMSFMTAWAGFLLPLIILSKSSMYPISVGLFSAFGIYGQVNYGQLAALSIAYMIPVIVLYALLRSTFSRGIGSMGLSEK